MPFSPSYGLSAISGSTGKGRSLVGTPPRLSVLLVVQQATTRTVESSYSRITSTGSKVQLITPWRPSEAIDTGVSCTEASGRLSSVEDVKDGQINNVRKISIRYSFPFTHTFLQYPPFVLLAMAVMIYTLLSLSANKQKVLTKVSHPHFNKNVIRVYGLLITRVFL